ncbi:acyltransferase family protein [Planctomycetaceae bacterium SH139]
MAFAKVTTHPLRAGGFDLLRIGAAIGVVVLHAAVPYLQTPMPGLVWPVTDMPSRLVNWLGWSIELVVMPIFLLLAGYFAAGQLTRLGVEGFVSNRFARLVLPLLLVGPLILTVDLYIWLCGWLVEGQVTPRKIRSLKFTDGSDKNLWGLGHLWFLQYVFFYCLGLAILNPALRYFADHQRKHWLLFGGLIISGGLTLLLRPEVVFGFQHAFLPVPSKWYFSATFFFGGALLAISPAILEWLQIHTARVLLVGMTATLLGVQAGNNLIQQIASAGQENFAEVSWTSRLVVASLAVTAGWLVSLGLFSLALRYDWKSGPRLSYLAAASFWIYLIHHPLVAITHISLKVYQPNMWPLVKLSLATGISLAFSLLSFELFVRRWPLAQLLGTPTSLCKGSIRPTQKSSREMPAEPTQQPTKHAA